MSTQEKAAEARGYPCATPVTPARHTQRALLKRATCRRPVSAGKFPADADHERFVIDAHLAVLAPLQLDADRLPLPRADGPREALRILLGARQELTTTATAQTNRLRALLLNGSDRDRGLSRAALTDATLSALARCRIAADATIEQAVRHDEIRRLSMALRQAARALTANRRQRHELANAIAPGLTDRRGLGPIIAAQAIVSYSHPGASARGSLRRAGRDQPATCQQRAHRPAPAQPGWRPCPQPRRAHHRSHPHA